MSTYVSVQVPEDRLGEVYELLARTSVTPSLPTSEQVASVGSDPAFWRSAENIAEHLQPRSKTIRGLAKYLASRADEDVTSDEAAEALALPYGWNSLAGALGAFGNYCSNRNLGFPWETKYETDDDRARLRLDNETARAILKYLR